MVCRESNDDYRASPKNITLISRHQPQPAPTPEQPQRTPEQIAATAAKIGPGDFYEVHGELWRRESEQYSSWVARQRDGYIGHRWTPHCINSTLRAVEILPGSEIKYRTLED